MGKVKCLGSDRQQAFRSQALWVSVTTPIKGRYRQMISGPHWPDRLAEMAGFRFSERFCFKERGEK